MSVTMSERWSTAWLRGGRQITQRQSLGLLLVFLGVYLLAGVAPFISNDSVTLAFETGTGAASLDLSPVPSVVFIGAVYTLTGVAALFTGPRAYRFVTAMFVVAAALFIPLVLIVSLALSPRDSTNMVQLLVESLRLGTPIALGSLAGLWSERSGVVNIGIEGMMLAGAGIGYMFYAVVGDASNEGVLWVSVLIAVLAGGAMAALHAMLSITFRVDQIVSGVVINLLAIGGTSFVRSEVIIDTGNESGETLSAIKIPLLNRIPIVGEPLFEGKPIFYMMFLVYALSALVLFKTPWGLRVRSVGENPHAAETLGVNVIKTRYQSVILGGLIAGLGGAWFSLETAGSFADLMTNGTGFIALAALIFGKWTPKGAFAGAMLFGFSRALGSRLQILEVEVGGFELPSQFMQSVPFVVTIVVLAGAVGRAVPPAAVGKPFERSR